MGQGDPRDSGQIWGTARQPKDDSVDDPHAAGLYTEEDCSCFALVLIPRDEIWWVPVSEVAGKKSICTNAEKDVLHQYRGNLGALKVSGVC